VSKLCNYRDEQSDPKPASDAAETERRGISRHVEPKPNLNLSDVPRHTLSAASMLYLGTILYVGVLLVNSLAILSEERFLARSSYRPSCAANCSSDNPFRTLTVGWGSSYNQAYGQSYDQTGYGGQQDISVKTRIISLISAVRMLTRSASLSPLRLSSLHELTLL
jgi:hypothetical protein